MAVRTYGGGGGRSGRSAVEGNFANTRAGNLATRGGAVSQVQELARQLANDIVKQRDYHLGVKLVRGAYYNQDLKYEILFTNIEQTHQSYNQAINLFCDYGDQKDQLIIASHNKDSVLLGINKNKDNIKYSQLMGMSDDLSRMIADSGNQVYKYLPYGNFMDTLPYLIRRLYENPRMFIYL